MTAVAVIPETGEMVPAFKMEQYLTALAGDAKTQQALAAAYDSACRALIGPNDIQKADGREFKKKSAWKKLARYFRVNVRIIRVEREWIGEHFVATAYARAEAPWGQIADDVGACSTDEATGRREISIADAIATAATRAENRAVSNLIAMGEVSAEEIGTRPAMGSRTAAIPTMPFGKTKGTPLADLDLNELNGALDWAASKGKFVEFQAEAKAEIARRSGGSQEADQPLGYDENGDPVWG